MPREKFKCIYDIEIFPNLATFSFKDYETGIWYRFKIFADSFNPADNINEINELLDFVEQRLAWAIGYNSLEFDDILLKALYVESKRFRIADPRKIITEIKALAQEIIDAQKDDKSHPRMYALRYAKCSFKSMDLMMIYNPIDRVSLKQLAIGMKWHTILESPFPFDHIVKKEEIPLVLEYNDNDVDITEALLGELAEEINNRIAFTIKYGTDVLNSPNSSIGRQIILDYYSKATGISQKELKKMRTNYTQLPLSDCIDPKIRFKTREYNRVLEEVKKSVIDPNKKEAKGKKKVQFQINLRSKYLTHTMMLGGVHSNNPAEIMEENDKFLYIDIDVRGYYPRIIINDRVFPAHLDARFCDILKEKIVDERMRIVKEEPVMSYMLKIAANAAFGLLDTESALKDPKAAKTITISGQLYLFMLMEWLELYSKCIVVYSNTDGLTVRVPRYDVNKFYHICQRWMQYTNFELEFNYYKKMIMRDVNNYLMFTYGSDPKKSMKAKGAYVIHRPIYKGYVYPIIPLAVREFYEKNIPIENTIINCRDIYMFMKAERTSMEKFDVVLYCADVKKGESTLQKNNRWVVTMGNPDEGRLVKISKATKERTEMQSGFRVTPVPNIESNASIDSYHLNYSFYINGARDLINLAKELNKETHIEIEQGTFNFT